MQVQVQVQVHIHVQAQEWSTIAVSVDEPLLPSDPLVRLRPVSADPAATIAETAEAIELRLQLVAARTHLAIAEAWDSGRLVKQEADRPPFESEVFGLLDVGEGYATEYLDRARVHVQAIEQMLGEAERNRSNRPTPIEALARDFGVHAIGMVILLVLAAPRLRGEIARLYKILTASDKRPLVDEQLLVQIIGRSFQRQIGRELDADRPLRKFGLVHVIGERPNGAIEIDPLVVRYISNRSYEGEVDRQLEIRHVDRDLEELELPRELIVRAMRYLAQPDPAPARIVVRGRTGIGRHTLIVSLAARAGRSVGIVDIGTLPRGPSSASSTLLWLSIACFIDFARGSSARSVLSISFGVLSISP